MMSLFFPLLFVSVLCMSSFSAVQGKKWKGEGTTQNLESIVIGRCYEYIRLVNPAVGEKNCSQIWEAFKNAFINKDPCSILPEDYELFINLTFHTIPPNKSLFWENNQLLVTSLAARGRRYMSVGDTLFGFLADFLIWCGQADSPGLDYESCPTMAECENNAVDSFWRIASVTYAKHSSGVIQVLLNGSAEGGAYPQPGFFADYEIPNFQKDKISQIVIWVVDDIEGPDRDSCGTNSVKTLETRLKTLGFDVTCTDNYKSVMFLLCLDYPDHSKCAFASESPDLLSLVMAAEVQLQLACLWEGLYMHSYIDGVLPAVQKRRWTAPSVTYAQFCNICQFFTDRKSAPAAQRGPISSDRGGSWNKLMFVSFAGFLFRFALVY